MTLDVLEVVKAQLEDQFSKVFTPDPNRPIVVQHMNAIELLGALQLIKQLIQQEQVLLQAPPGATGPTL